MECNRFALYKFTKVGLKQGSQIQIDLGVASDSKKRLEGRNKKNEKMLLNSKLKTKNSLKIQNAFEKF
jgi:hypothetical protein